MHIVQVVGVEDGGVVLKLFNFGSCAQFLKHLLGGRCGRVVGIEEGGVSVAVEEGAVQVNHMKALKFIC